MLQWLGNIADYLKVRLYTKIEQQIEKRLHSWHNNYTFAGHTFMTRNSNQTTRGSLPGGVDRRLGMKLKHE